MREEWRKVRQRCRWVMWSQGEFHCKRPAFLRPADGPRRLDDGCPDGCPDRGDVSWRVPVFPDLEDDA
jgi:hypothetical protein